MASRQFPTDSTVDIRQNQFIIWSTNQDVVKSEFLTTIPNRLDAESGSLDDASLLLFNSP